MAPFDAVAPQTAATDPFQGPPGGWTPVSPRLAAARRLLASATVVGLTALAIAVAVAAGVPEWGFVALVLGLGALVWCYWLIGRQVRAMGYAERSDDLLVVSGILFRRLVIVPYGRMQLVDVNRGPIDRRFDLATVQLHTAAATSDAAIRGLTPDVAARLRDQLAALGEQRSAGL
ncbi:MAG: PH domain-containing protein [Actinomycetes bacterium]